jgi:hypothetical protein
MPTTIKNLAGSTPTSLCGGLEGRESLPQSDGRHLVHLGHVATVGRAVTRRPKPFSHNNLQWRAGRFEATRATWSHRLRLGKNRRKTAELDCP